MYLHSLKPVALVAIQNAAQNFYTSSSHRSFKVTVCGAAGGIGQPLALLLKQNPLISHLACCDVMKVMPGVAMDLSHINTPSIVTGHKGPGAANEAIRDSDVVVIPAGVSRKPGMTRDDLFKTNASIIRDLTAIVACCAPRAIIAIITNPVNSMVPIASEVMRQYCALDPCRIIGVTTLDVVRAATFIGEINCVDPRCVHIPVIGGHAGATIIPVLSQSMPPIKLSDQCKIEALTKRIQDAGTEVVKAKAGAGSATLSMAFAATRVTNAILRGLNGERNVVECAYLRSNCTEATYFATPVLFGKNGVQTNLGYGKLNEYETCLLKAAVPILQKNIQSGEDFMKMPAAC